MAFTLTLGSKAPDFHLRDTNGKWHTLINFKNSPYLVIFFTCNHCPYVTGSNEITLATVLKYTPKGVTFVGINSNSAHTYPEDSYEGMVAEMKKHHFPWLYLHDATQEIALKYGALRTPHFYLFDQERSLVYTGRAIDQPREPKKATVNDLENALEDLIAKRPIALPITNPIGCNVKWEGKDAHWMPPEACDLV